MSAFLAKIPKPLKKAVLTTIFTASVFAGTLFNSCSNEPAKSLGITPVKVVETNRRPGIRRVYLNEIKNQIIVDTDGGKEFIFKLDDAHSLENANIIKVSNDLWCILNIGGTNDIIDISPKKLNMWTISASNKLIKPFTQGAKLLHNTFCVFPDSTAIILSDSNEVYRLYHEYVSQRSKDPSFPMANPYSQKERVILFGKYAFNAVRKNETIPLSDEVTGRMEYLEEYGCYAARFTHPGWKKQYWIYFEKATDALGDRIKILSAKVYQPEF